MRALLFLGYIIRVITVKVCLKSFLSRFCMFCAYTRPRYQVSVYRIIGPLVFSLNKASKWPPFGKELLLGKNT